MNIVNRYANNKNHFFKHNVTGKVLYLYNSYLNSTHIKPV